IRARSTARKARDSTSATRSPGRCRTTSRSGSSASGRPSRLDAGAGRACPPGVSPFLRMLSVLRSGALQGIEAAPVTVEVDIAFGLPGFSLVGLPDSAVKEARERVFAALKNSGYE